LRVGLLKRIVKAYSTIGQNFGIWFLTIPVALYITFVRTLNFIFMKLDWLLYPVKLKSKVKRPILIVGNPRSGTTFIHRYLSNQGLGIGSKLYQLIFTSVLLQKLIKPILPILEKVSPTKYHSTAAHKTSLGSIETDDASMLFRFFDGFFLYGFIMSWAKEDLFPWFDPKKRNNSNRDFKWFESMWVRTLISTGNSRIIGKLFSISPNVPAFLNHFPDAKLLYMVRDPLSVIPSGLSLVTGVLDGWFGFWSLPEERRRHYINRLYKALVELQIRFHDDWVNNRIDKAKVGIVQYNRMMTDFDGLMDEVLTFVEHERTPELMEHIKETADKQRAYKSNHKYDLSKFGITEEQIKSDCAVIYETFLSKTIHIGK